MNALATASNNGSGQLNGLLLLLPLVLLVVMFFLSRRRQRQFQVQQAQIAVGDEVSTTSGLLGTLVELDDNTGVIEAAPGVQLRFDRRAIVPARVESAGVESTGAESAPTQLDSTSNPAPASHDTDEPKA